MGGGGPRFKSGRPDYAIAPGADQPTDWLAVLDDEALYCIAMAERDDEPGGLRVRVQRVPFDLIELSTVTDARVNDHGAWRLQRSWHVLIGRQHISLDEDRVLGARLDSEDRFIHELARRTGWPVNTELIES